MSGSRRPRRIPIPPTNRSSKTPQPPQVVPVVPPGLAADSGDGAKRLPRRGVYPRGPGIHPARSEPGPAPGPRRAPGGERVGPTRCRKAQVLVHQRASQCFADCSGPHGEVLERPGVAYHGLVPNTVDQLPPYAGVERRHQAEPETGESRCEHRHSQHSALETAEPAVFPHEVAIGYSIGSADLVDRAPITRQLQRRDEVGHQIFDPDRLGCGVHPAWGHHHRKLLDQGAHQLERQATGAEHDRGAEFDGRNSRLAENQADLLPAREVAGELGSFPQSAEIDDASDAGGAGRGRKAAGALPVAAGHTPGPSPSSGSGNTRCEPLRAPDPVTMDRAHHPPPLGSEDPPGREDTRAAEPCSGAAAGFHPRAPGGPVPQHSRWRR